MTHYTLLSMALTIPCQIYIFSTPLDKSVLSMVCCEHMDDGQTLLADLKEKGWTNTSIAGEIGVTVNAVEKWQAGDRNISHSRFILLTQLTKRKRIPSRKRYQKGSRNQGGNNGQKEARSTGC